MLFRGFSVVFVLLGGVIAVHAEEPNSLNPAFRSTLEFLKQESAPEFKPYTETIPGTEISFKMVPIPGGKFRMGSPVNEQGHQKDEEPQHEVEIKPFWMEEHETTWKEFELFVFRMRKNPEKRTDRDVMADTMAKPTQTVYNLAAISHDNAGKPGYPASGMTMLNAQLYCKWLTILTGHYYRLPTEAEWEYACRAGTTTAFSFGNDSARLDDFAWHFGNSGGRSQVVKTKKPNAWGLYDMHGNLAEWVLEQYAVDSYAHRDAKKFGDPIQKPSTIDFGQTVRGGHCEDDDPTKLRSAARGYSVAAWKSQDPMKPQSFSWTTDAPFVGFRVVRPLQPPTTDEESAPFEPDTDAWRKANEK